MHLIYEEIQNLTLVEIEKLLQSHKKSLKDYPPMSYPNDYVTSNLENQSMHAKLNYNVAYW